MIKRANKYHEIRGKQYFVMPTPGNRLAVVDNTYINEYNRNANKLGLSKITYVDLLEMCYYKTPAGSYTRNLDKLK